MSTVTLVKPRSVCGPLIEGTFIGTGKSEGFPTVTFWIKCTGTIFRYRSPVQETTGDGDCAPVLEHNHLLYGRHRIRGYMVADQAEWVRKIAALDSNGNVENPVSNPSGDATSSAADFIYHLGNGHSHSQRVIVEEAAIAHEYTGVYVAIQLLVHKIANTDGKESLVESYGS